MTTTTQPITLPLHVHARGVINVWLKSYVGNYDPICILLLPISGLIGFLGNN